MRIQKMTAALRKMILLAVCCVMAVVCAVGVSASGVADHDMDDGKRTITVNFRYNDNPVSGGNLELFQVANVKVDDGYKFVYIDAFKDLNSTENETGYVNGYDISEGSALGKSGAGSVLDSLVRYIDTNSIKANTSTTAGTDGNIVFTNLSWGLYLLRQTSAADGYYRVSPFLVTIPFIDDKGNYQYDVNATSKMETLRPTPPDTPTPTPSPATATVEGRKRIVDASNTSTEITDVDDGAVFVFTLTRNNSANPMPNEATTDSVSTTVTGPGSFSFGTIIFTTPGNYVYTVREVTGDNDNYQYSSEVYTIEFEVRASTGNALTVYSTTLRSNEQENPSSIVFTNPREKSPVDVPVSVWKTVRDSSRSGQEITEIPADNYFDFTFTRDDPSYPMPAGSSGDTYTATITGRTGLLSIGTLRFTEPKKYSYTVTEVPNTNGHYTYDEAEHYEYSTETYKVEYVVDESSDHTRMEVKEVRVNGNKVDNPNSFNMTFTNVYYQPTPSGNKGDISTPLVVRKLVTDATRAKNKIKTIKSDNFFDFVISRESGSSNPMPGGASGDTVMVRVTASDYNSGNGTKSAGSITFKEAGTYTYTIKEVKNTNGHYDFDDVDQYDFSDEEYTLTYVVGTSADGEKLVIESITISKDGSQMYEGTDPHAFSILFSNVYHEKEPSGSITPTPTTTTTPTPTPTTPNGGGGGGGGSSRLPQTGQLWWPVWLLCAAGVILILSGFLARRNRK